MTWDPSTSCGYESSKIASIVLPYLRGKALDLGCGNAPVWPRVIAVDNGAVFGDATAGVRGDIEDLSLFADASCDAVFSSHALEDFPAEKIPGVLREWSRILKVGGYLCLYVPSANLYPKMGEPGANPAHKVDIYAGDIQRWLLAGTDCGWTQVECEERGETNEYSWFEVYRKRDDGVFAVDLWQRNPDGRKRALVIRYGAIGDQIVAASVLPGLKAQGYHITYNTTPDAQQIVLHDPHIDEFLIQDKDYVPNAALGAYWASLAERYDLVVNLCESIEGALLKLPGRLDHLYSDSARRRMYGTVNYLERTHDIAGVPYDFAQRFYPTADERKWAIALRKTINAPVVAWAIAGSSQHKIYPYTDIVVRWLLDQTSAHVFLLGDAKEGKQLQSAILQGLGEHDAFRLHPVAGLWEIRKVLTFVQHCDVVVGPETGVLNGVAMESVAKVIYLSHSSATNLTKHWVNTEVLTPIKAPCYPCHRLHYDGSYCHQVERTGAALCASNISPERVFAAIASAAGAGKVAA